MDLFEINKDKFERKQEGQRSRGVEPAPREGTQREADRWDPPA